MDARHGAMELASETGESATSQRFALRLTAARRRVLTGIEAFAQRVTHRALREQMLDYPLRPAKAIRPALMFASAEAFGSSDDAVVPAAVALELCHNAFLLHDDVEDHSAFRRHRPTMHVQYGVPAAINTGDGMFALAIEPLLACTQTMGLGRTLRILRMFSRMCIATAEGQATELAWIHDANWAVSRDQYVRMVHRKTAHYTFVVPILVGAIAGRVGNQRLLPLALASARLGIAFQIADDLLSINSTASESGKDTLGDLYEGKRTLVLLEALNRASPRDRAEALAILERQRPSHARLRITQLASQYSLPAAAVDEFCRLLPPIHERTGDEVRRLTRLIERTDAVAATRAYAMTLVERARAGLRAVVPEHDSDAARFLIDAGPYALERTH